MVVDETTGHSKCDSCKDGTHNPNPVKFHKCPCKPHLEPADGAPGTCSPCSEGYYKDSGMRHDAACKKCPHPKTYSDVGATRCCRSPCVVDCVLDLMILCSEAECNQPPGSGAVAQWTHERRKNAKAMTEYIKNQVAVFITKLKSWWIGLTDYLKASASDTWSNVDEMFAEFDKEGYVIPASDFDAGTKKECASLLFASLCYLQSHRCKFFWFFCRDVQKFEEPDDPNKCPYKTKQLYLEHIQAQPEWREWRAAPLEQRRRLARQIAKLFHPDKCVASTSSCRHCMLFPISLYSI